MLTIVQFAGLWLVIDAMGTELGAFYQEKAARFFAWRLARED
jgi:hypothetical protein